MKHDLGRIWIYKLSDFIALLENHIMKDTKRKKIAVIIYVSFPISTPSFANNGFKFSFCPTGFKE